ncbi:MAG: DHHA1 domain-containing protein [Chloroflexota bacterium]
MPRPWIDPPQIPPPGAPPPSAGVAEPPGVYFPPAHSQAEQTVLAAGALAAELGLHPVAAQALARRGFSDPTAARAFLDPALYPFPPPHDLPGVTEAAARLARAIERQETILVWGDFDVDGQTATAVLVGVLQQLGGRVRYHIPVRAQESHGVGPAVLEQLLEQAPAPALVLTCDTGATAFDAAELAGRRGVDWIITDHHQFQLDADGAALLPPACAVVSPRRLPSGQPFSGLPGVGVAYVLMQALCAAAGRPALAEAQLDLAALGIVADVAPLTGATRALLQRGLACLRQTPRLGLQAIFNAAGVAAAQVDEQQIGFVLGPRLNALGRLSDANPAVELLTTADPARADLLALQLEALNARRQMISSQIQRSALEKLARQPRLLDGAALVLSSPGWEAGVIGIVAGRLVELFDRPVALVAFDKEGLGRGSIRSIPGIDVTRALAQANAGPQPLLQGFGGHAMAAGFALRIDDLPAFERRFERAVAGQAAAPAADAADDAPAVNAPEAGEEARPAAGQPPVNALQIDAWVEWSSLDLALAQALGALAPFGEACPPPLLASRRLRLRALSSFGRTAEHLALTVEDAAGAWQRVTWWGGVAANEAALAAAAGLGAAGSGAGGGAGEPGGGLQVGSVFDLAFTLRAGYYQARLALQIELVDYRLLPPETAPTPAVNLVDLRAAAAPMAALRAWWLALPADWRTPGAIQVWAEGEDRRRLEAALAGWADVPGAPAELQPRGRGELAECRALVVWTAPPSPVELAQALQVCRPQTLVAVGLPPAEDAPRPFLVRLAGMVKYALAHQAGRLDLERLAAGLAQRTPAARCGLDWMAAEGHLRRVDAPQASVGGAADGGQLWATPGGPRDPQAAAALLETLEALLAESRAYRAYFQRDWTLLPSASK